MTRGLAVLVAAVAMLAASGNAQAESFDLRDIMGGGPDFRGYSGGASPIQRSTVNYSGNYAPGTIVINTGERRLYLVLANGQALSYGIGVGRDGFRWSGTHRITAKKEWPGWTPPAQMLRRRPDLPRHMPGGVENPLGARAMYLFNRGGDMGYRLHGSPEWFSIGKAMSSGCIRLMNQDIIDLYDRTSVGAKVIVL